MTDADLQVIRARWGYSREDFDWSLHGNATHGEQAVKDIRAMLSHLDTLQQQLDELHAAVFPDAPSGVLHTASCRLP